MKRYFVENLRQYCQYNYFQYIKARNPQLRIFLILPAFLVFNSFSFLHAQQNKTDANVQIHLMQPDYPVPYSIPSEQEIRNVLNRVFNYLDKNTPTRLINKETGKEITDFSKPDKNTILYPGDFRIISYEWGVTYAGMLAVADITSDSRFSKYVSERFNFISDMAPYFRKFGEEFPNVQNPFRTVVMTNSLDDAGAMCAAMIKATSAGINSNLRPLIDNYSNHICNNQMRLSDGTFARNRPLPNSMWLDDLYMSVPALAWMGKLTGDKKYWDDATKQILQFASRMFNKDKGLYIHGWVQDMNVHPEFLWGRANGWAIMATVELLDVLPLDYPKRNELLDLLKAHVKGLAGCQSGTGLWHQLLDRNDSYPETSASAMFTFGIAKAINEKWIDEITYGPMVVAAWNALTTQVNEKGQVMGTCVGTGMAFEPVYYYYRPVSEYAAHGYGPILLAGSEMIKIVRNSKIHLNPNILMYKPD